MFVVTKGWKHKEIDAEERRDKDEAWMKERWNDIVKKQSGLNIDVGNLQGGHCVPV